MAQVLQGYYLLDSNNMFQLLDIDACLAEERSGPPEFPHVVAD